MMNEFVYNTMYSPLAPLTKVEALDFFQSHRLVVVGDEHQIACHLVGTMCQLRRKEEELEVHLVLEGESDHPDMIDLWQEEWPMLRVWKNWEEFRGAVPPNMPEYILRLVNLRSGKYGDPSYREGILHRWESLLEAHRSNSHQFLQLVTCIPEIREPLPKELSAVAEREYAVVFRDKPEDSPEKFLLKLEGMMKGDPEQVKRLQAIRVDRIFGPGITAEDGAGVLDILEEIRDRGTMKLMDKDRREYYSLCYVRDAILGILMAGAIGRRGNVYQVTSWEHCRLNSVMSFYEILRDRAIRLETSSEGEDQGVTYRMLNGKKLQLIHRSNLAHVLYTDKETALRDTAYWYLGINVTEPSEEFSVYYNRMPRIREVELEILREVDALCKEHNISYFLTAGTMLGAVRHGGFIPWDDDVDIGILPEDYEKLLKVLPDHLSVEYGYQTVGRDRNSHYIHDKIRLKNSFFSTKYSDRYEMLNGVYIDVFVYYKTSNRPWAQKLHIKEAMTWRSIIGICWAPFPTKARLASIKYRIAYAIFNPMPASWADYWYRKCLMRYDRSRSRYRIDGGFNLDKVGAVPDEWFHGTTEWEFEGFKFPILAHYDDFLRHWYGSHYMELLPLDARKSVHSVVRIDLGQHLFDETIRDRRFSDVDLRGELFEK